MDAHTGIVIMGANDRGQWMQNDQREEAAAKSAPKCVCAGKVRGMANLRLTFASIVLSTMMILSSMECGRIDVKDGRKAR